MGLFKFSFLAFISLAILFIVNPIHTSAIVLPDIAVNHMPVCAPGNPATPRCHAQVVTDSRGKPQVTASPSGYGPVQLLSAYNLSASTSATRTIAIVDAYDHPSILQDLNMYSTTYGIPQMSSCPISSGTLASPCFQKVDQRGGVAYPTTNSGWALEIALDVEVAHAICQNCNILLVEADSSSYTNLMSAVDRAVTMGATVVSNSYGSNEFSSETSYDYHFAVPGVAFTFSSGDGGYGAQYPAASRYVTAVGGTTLTLSGSNYLSEKAWNGTGSGCSAYEAKPSWQKDKDCVKRTIADVSAVADPATGAAVYDSVAYNGQTGWFVVGGTSLAAPLVAGVYALAGDVVPTQQANAMLYNYILYGTNMRDMNSGSNGHCKKNSYLCTSITGYDGPTGLGTPKGISAF